MGRMIRGATCDICGEPIPLLSTDPYDSVVGCGRKFTVAVGTPFLCEVHEITACWRCTRKITNDMLHGASIMEALLALSAERVLIESDEERSK